VSDFELEPHVNRVRADCLGCAVSSNRPCMSEDEMSASSSATLVCLSMSLRWDKNVFGADVFGVVLWLSKLKSLHVCDTSTSPLNVKQSTLQAATI